MYSDLYAQRLKYSREDQWPHQILNHSTVTGWENLPNDRIALHVCRGDSCDDPKGETARNSILEADVVIAATGYRRDAHEDLLRPARHLLPGPDRRFQVERDYRVKFRDGAVSDDAGVWLQGCNENTHGVSKSLVNLMPNLAAALTVPPSSAILCSLFLLHEVARWSNHYLTDPEIPLSSAAIESQVPKVVAD